MIGDSIRQRRDFACVFDLQLRDQITARAIFAGRQIFARVVLPVPSRLQSVFVDREIVDLRFAVKDADQLSFESQIPRLIVPSIGGGTKRNGTLRVSAADADGEIVGEGKADCSGIVVGVGDSCANDADAKPNRIKNRRLSFFVIVAALYERRTISATVIDRRYSNSAS